MKTYKKVLHYWFAIASLVSFLGGWIMLAHSPKPVQPAAANVTSLSTLPPIQAFGSGGNNNGLNFFSPNNSPSNPQPGTGFPLLRTGGS